jgi:hypothetical protein
VSSREADDEGSRARRFDAIRRSIAGRDDDDDDANGLIANVQGRRLGIRIDARARQIRAVMEEQCWLYIPDGWGEEIRRSRSRTPA